MTADDVRVDAYVGEARVDLTADGRLPGARNVHATSLDASRKPQYYLSAFRAASRELRKGTVDVYMHMNLDYRWFNPLALNGCPGDVPFVVGPSQAGHSINREEFALVANHLPGPDVPSSVINAMYTVFDPLRRLLLDPVRLDLFKRTLQAADRIIVVHKDAKRVYEQFVEPSRLTVIPLGVPSDAFPFSEPPEGHDVVVVGALRERKGYDVLLNAFSKVQTVVPEASLHVFGDGPLDAALKRRAERLGIRENITFHGFVHQSVVREHMQRARLFVHPSRSESFSLVRLEAMSTGCPVVVSNTAGATEMVTDGEEGFVVPIEDADALAEAMQPIMTDLDLARKLGRNARETVEQRYDWQVISQQYLDVIREVA